MNHVDYSNYAVFVLEELCPKAKYDGKLCGFNEQEYNDIIWKDERPKPSWQDMLDKQADMRIHPPLIQRQKKVFEENNDRVIRELIIAKLTEEGIWPTV